MKANNGYIGYSMSVRAGEAYKSGERPISKWRKSDIVEEIKELELDNFSMDLLKKLNLKTLKNYVLEISSWHHTGKLFNETDFYSIDVNYLENLTDERILELIEEQNPSPLTIAEKAEKKAIRDKKKAEQEERKKQRELKAEKEKLFKYQARFKTLNRFLSSENIDLIELREIRSKKIEEKREELTRMWKNQLDPDHWNWKNINDDDFIDSYIR